MREILFRGKRIDNGEWVYGYYVRVAPSFDDPEEESLIYTDEHNIYGETVSLPVNPRTVGQYTGLTDKHSHRIFEGDILKYRENLFIVKYIQACAHFSVDPVKKAWSWYPDLNAGNTGTLEVVGNIYDNPEVERLMKNKGES